MKIREWLKNIFWVEHKPIEKTEYELLFQKMMDEIVEDGKTYFNIYTNEDIWVYSKHMNVFCDEKYANSIRYFEDRQNIAIREYSFYDIRHNMDVVLTDVYISEHSFFYGEHYFVLNYGTKKMTYHPHKLETYKLAFPDGYAISNDVYKKYEPDFKKYGFWLDFKDGTMLLRHPKEEIENE